MKEKEFDKMGVESLIAWSNLEEALDEEPIVWRELERQLKSKAPQYFRQMDICQLNEFYRNNPHDDIPAWLDAWTDAYQSSWPFEELFERIKAIEKTLDVITKAIGDTDPKITLNQLIKLKGGYL